jgi:PAS domain-containing protein
MLEVRLLYKQLEEYSEKLEMKVIERTAQLSASEARFKNFTELTSDWYWEQDGQGKFTTVSGPVFEMLGIEAGAGNDFELSRWNEAELANLKYNIATRRPFFDFVYTLKKANGQYQHLQVSGEPMFDSACRFIGYRGVGVEISDQHYAYRKEANFRKAIDVINLGVCLINRTTLAVLDANEMMCVQSKYTRAELLNTTLLQLNIGTEEQLKSTFDNVISSRTAGQLSEQLYCGDRTSRDVLVDFHAFMDDDTWIIVAAFNFSGRTV